MQIQQIPQSIIGQILKAQRSEITEHVIYTKLSRSIKDSHNRGIVEKIAKEEKSHYETLKKHTGKDVKPDRWKTIKFFWITRIFGITFGIKLLERGEGSARISYETLSEFVPDAEKIAEDEDAHEQQLIGIIREERLDYVGSIVLGLNDALVELTGALAGFSFALQNTRLIAVVGLITGVAASFSMAASEYLSQKSEGQGERALRSSVYTGTAYIATVALLILPFLLFENFLICLMLTLMTALMIIFLFNYYIAVAKDLNFKSRFLEMASISLGVSAITFGIGFFIRNFFGIEI